VRALSKATRKVSVETLSTSVNDLGGLDKTWGSSVSLWAERRNTKGASGVEADRQIAEAEAVFTVKHSSTTEDWEPETQRLVVEEFGNELITNPNFESASGWTLDTNATISGGKMILAASSGISYQSIDLDDGARYRCEFEISSHVSGSLKPYLNGTNGTNVSADGSFVESLAAGSANTIAGVNPSGTMNVNRFSIRKILPTYFDILSVINHPANRPQVVELYCRRAL
tara:strand:+ start:103 stop:786 length:684 start_codon:yes stop_codon:yes gene_type:complete